MAGFNDILKSTQWLQSIEKSLGLSSQLSEIMKAQERVNKFSIGLGLAKTMQMQMNLVKSIHADSDRLDKILGYRSKYAIPQPATNALLSIHDQHTQLFSGIRAMTEGLKDQLSALAQINNLHFALNGISGQIAALAVQQKNWSIIDDYEQVSKQAVEFSESLTEEITEEQQRQFEILLSTIVAFFNKQKTLRKASFRLINIFLIIAGIHQYFDFLKEKPELATKTEVNQIKIKQDSISYYLQTISEQLKQTKDYRITNRICQVKSKPRIKTWTVSKLPKDFELVVLQVHHKWVLVSYFDPKDNLPQTGWIMKKYLSKPV